MNGVGEETAFEIGVVVPKRTFKEGDKGCDCVELLVSELGNAELIVERVNGLSDEFIKLAAPMKTLGRAATELQMKKLTHIGIDIPFEWDQVDAFVRQPDDSLFNWCERFRCFHHLIYGIVNRADSSVTLHFDDNQFQWGVGESLLGRMESEGIVKQVYPLHDETKRKRLLRNWALNWRDFTWQPIDEIYSYFGTKIATYFAFLGMYTRWLFFPAAFGVMLWLIDFGSWQLLVLPIFFTFIVSWAVLFIQFWKRKNSALLTRWQISHMAELETGYKGVDAERSVPSQFDTELQQKVGSDKSKGERNAIQRDEWFGQLLRFRNDAIVVLGIIFLQLPVELAYAHLYEVTKSDITRFGLTALYILVIQYYTRTGGKISVKLVKYENNKSSESNANSLVYKVFGLYFMQSYIGLFYYAIVYRNFKTLRQVLIQRLIVSQVLDNLVESSIPYLKYTYKKFSTVRKIYSAHLMGSLIGMGHSLVSPCWMILSVQLFGCKDVMDVICVRKSKKKREDGSSAGKKVQLSYRVEKEYLKPTYSASNGQELEDGLFDDFLELALQFGMIMMFACAFPVAFAFAALNNITEIRSDALRLLVMLRRPVPRAAATIGAWLNIFQFLMVMSICTNCVLLVCLYDQEGKWRIEPGLAAILVIEHCLLLIKFLFSHFVPEEPAWVKATRVKNAAQTQDICSKQLRSIYSQERKTN